MKADFVVFRGYIRVQISGAACEPIDSGASTRDNHDVQQRLNARISQF